MSVTVRIGSDVRGAEQGIDRVKKSLRDLDQQMGRNITRSAKWGAAITATGVALAGKMTRDTMQAIDAQSKLSRALDSTIDGLTALQLAGDRSGVSINDMNRSMERYIARLGEARRGTGMAVDALDRLGVSAEELARNPVDVQMQMLGQRFRELNLDASQSADVLRDLGIRNADMARFLREGAQELDRTRAMVERYGLSLSAIDASKVEAANDAIQEMGLAGQGIRQAFAVEISDTVTAVALQISEQFGVAGDNMRKSIGAAVDTGVRGLATFMEAAADTIDFISANPMMAQFGVLGFVLLGPKGAALGATIGGIFEVVRRELNSLGIGIEGVEKGLTQSVDLTQQIGELMREMSPLLEKQAELQEKGEDMTRRERAHLEAINNQLEDRQFRLDRLNEVHAEINDELTGTEEAQAELNRLLEEGTGEANNFTEALRGIADAMRGSRDGTGPELSAIPDAPRVDIGDDPEIQHEQEKIERLKGLYGEYHDWRLASGEDFNKTDAQKAQDHRDAMLQIERDRFDQTMQLNSQFWGNLSSLMDVEQRGLFEIGKAAAISQAIIDGIQSTISSYRVGAAIGGPIAGAAFAATAAVATGAQIAKLASTQYGSSGGVSAPPSSTPQVPSQVNNVNKTTANITLNVSGGGDPQNIISALREALADDVVLFDRNSAQGRQFA